MTHYKYISYFLALIIVFTTSLFANTVNDCNDCYIKRKFNKALRCYKSVYNEINNTEVIQLNIANVYYYLEDYEKAIEYYNKVLIRYNYQKDDFTTINDTYTNAILAITFYNMANTYYKMYEQHCEQNIDDNINLYKALETVKRCLIIDNNLIDARLNYCIFYKKWKNDYNNSTVQNQINSKYKSNNKLNNIVNKKSNKSKTMLEQLLKQLMDKEKKNIYQLEMQKRAKSDKFNRPITKDW